VPRTLKRTSVRSQPLGDAIRILNFMWKFYIYIFPSVFCSRRTAHNPTNCVSCARVGGKTVRM